MEGKLFAVNAYKGAMPKHIVTARQICAKFAPTGFAMEITYIATGPKTVMPAMPTNMIFLSPQQSDNMPIGGASSKKTSTANEFVANA
eukprot:CAMPEP_0195512756 /NCGR_PEP_ID=MMETSP0794_2-20130614/4611_1 /TAXON_ID=515487 /ORGANISM="Stephanopyxis turris, Strain CCMP 815" /LENGTH=87 /DNA_ID=CAMNT_0040640619 /DNA_START=287 /DNA_END=550 /DNA_ORIENTATION=-